MTGDGVDTRRLYTGSAVERVWSIGSTFGMVVMTPLGFRNGYVRIPDDHPWNGAYYDDLHDVDVHGGLTFSGRFEPDTYAAKGGSTDGIPDGWWIGFDCAHWQDAPEPDVYASAFAGLRDDWRPSYPVDGHVWTTAEVAAECVLLAEQVMDVIGADCC